MTSPSLQQIAFGDFEHEIAMTRRMLERVPEDRLGWRPHPKSGTLGQLASHVASALAWQARTMSHDDFDFIGPDAAKFRLPQATSRAELLETFDRTAADVRAALGGVTDDAAWQRPWTLRRGAQTLFEMPKLAVFRGMGINHLVHHRAQLGVYLRLLDVPVPGMYGPSADEMGS